MCDLISYAFDSNKNLISSFDAIKGENYFCPCCSESFIFRKGKIKRPHFAHKADSNCSKESIFHKTAKILIRDMVKNFLLGLSDYYSVFHRHCIFCSDSSPYCVFQQIPPSVDDVCLEYRLENGYVVDVALMSNSLPIAAIEVFYRHKVDNEKAANLSIPFMEVSALKIIDNPWVFESLRDTFRPKENPACRLEIEQREFEFFYALGYPPSECISPFLRDLEEKTLGMTRYEAVSYLRSYRANSPFDIHESFNLALSISVQKFKDSYQIQDSCT